jgi:2-polyprenyl-3-methyl-5-hydroxy-6-metoxy-1,4-benzoquinol methylase
MKNKLHKLVTDPFGVLKNRITSFRNILRYRAKSGYKAEKYWQDRHEKYGLDLRGVGDFTMTQEENLQILEEGGRLMLEICSRENVDLREVSMLDAGCGTGFYADVFRKAGGRTYMGIDIVDTLFDNLRRVYPEFQFRKLDISTMPIEGTYDLIIMMDVVQHIADEEKFRYAMENLKSHLDVHGTIIISTSIGDYKRRSFYNVTRPLSVFESIFTGYEIAEPLPFYQNKMFSIRERQSPQ